MKVFISSVIGGMEQQRDAVESAVESLGHDVIRAEGFAASGASPRVACLSGVREANLIVLLLGARYGDPLPPDDLAATHQEYREAKGSKPILAFIEEGAAFESRQAEFVTEVEDWEQGVFRSSFASIENLRRQVTRALHQHEVASAVAPVDSQALLERAIGILEPDRSGYHSSSGPRLRLALVGGPTQRILRPAEIEDGGLREFILRDVLVGERSIFDPASGTSPENVGDRLILRQDTGSFVSVNESGEVTFGLRIETASAGFPVLIEEAVTEKMARAFQFAAHLLDHIDRSQKLSRIAIAAAMEGADYVAWRRKGEFDPNATSMTLGHSFRGDRSGPVHLSPADVARSALNFDATRIAEDLTALLRRQGSA